ncbi:nucleotidyl transferase AbiEii/AbiGii toxin family protein [Deferribacteraceae bacterium V6Fe1]|nr:nucleotidyl transferase AbiEii/AbiGii toxin family protein [Deferribacteraceae bacterium V6Fe1]
MNDLIKLNSLLPETREVLLKLIKNCNFLKKYAFVGGSALALHLNHRKSEDLDFFTYENYFNKSELIDISIYFKNFSILNETDKQIDLLADGVKITFFNSSWSFLKPKNILQFNLATIEQLTAMKVNTLFVRATYRDYYDLYFITKHANIGLKKIFELSKNILSGITMKLFFAALLYVDDIFDDTIDHLSPKIIISKEEIRDYFQNEINKLKNDIL